MIEKSTGIAKEFICFLKKFGVIGLAIGVVVGTAVKDYVDSIVKSLVTPLINVILSLIKFQPGGKIDLLSTTVVDKTTGQKTYVVQSLLIGDFISSTISFLVLMAIVFFAVKFVISRFITKEEMESMKM